MNNIGVNGLFWLCPSGVIPDFKCSVVPQHRRIAASLLFTDGPTGLNATVLRLFTFSDLALAFQRFTCKHCLQMYGLMMRSFTVNRFPIKICDW